MSLFWLCLHKVLTLPKRPSRQSAPCLTRINVRRCGVSHFVRMDEEKNDSGYCLRKAAEFRRKAAATTDWLLRTSYEAVAREFEERAELLRNSQTASA